MPQINLTAPINGLGYGVVGHNVLTTLTSLGYEVSWFPIGPVELTHPRAQPIYQKGVDGQATYDANAPSLKIWHQFDLAQHVGKGLHCALPIFELDSLRPNEINHLRQQDMIYATTEWHREVLLQYPLISDNVPTHVVPLGVDTDIFKPSYDIQPDPNWTTFLNCGKWEYRKGHDVLIDAFNLAFDPTDRVRLWMLSHNIFLEPKNNKGVDGNKEWQDLYTSGPMGKKVSFLPRHQFHENVVRIMQEADCGVFPSRAEGWNLEALEMMACGKPVILTNYSGHTGFADQFNSRLIDVHGKEEAYDGKWFFGNEKGFGNWATFNNLSMDQLVTYMREIHKKKLAEGNIFNAGGVKTAKKFTWSNTVDHILGVMPK